MASTVVILGSPRNGNSDAIAMAIANAKKNDVKVFKINKMNAKGCQSCYGCKKAGKCVVKDDIAELLDAVRAADNIVLATPTYFGQATAQFRMFEDRCFGFLGGDFSSNLAPGKKVAIAITCGSGIDGANKIADQLAGEWSNFFKAEVVGKIVKGGMMAPDAAANDAAVMAEAKAIGEKF